MVEGIHQEKATNALLKMAEADQAGEESAAPRRRTLLGVDRSKLMRHFGKRDIAPPTKALEHFRKTTADRRSRKTKSSCWPGFGSQPPLMRKKQGMITPSMVGVSTTALVASQGLTIGKFAMLVKKRKSELAKNNFCPVRGHVQGAATPSKSLSSPTPSCTRPPWTRRLCWLGCQQ